MAEAEAPRQPSLGKHLWPAFGKPRVPGDVLFWPRDDQRVLGIPIKFTHWAVYVGRRKLAPCGTRWMVDVCETTGEAIPESVVHLWGAADSATRDTSADAVVVRNRLDELGGVPYDGNLEYDKHHTPRRPEQILHRVLVSLGTQKVYETRFGKYHVVGNNCEHFATWSRYGVNRSDQIGDGVKFIGASLGGVGLGVPGAFIGGLAAEQFVRSTLLARRNESVEMEAPLFENTDGCEFADDDREADWVVECLIRGAEDAEKREDAEREAHASGRAHLPRSAETRASDSARVASRAGSDAPETSGSPFERAAATTRADDAAAERGDERREGFSVDSMGNVGGVLGEGLRAFGEGLRDVMMRDGEATEPTERAAPDERRGANRESLSSSGDETTRRREEEPGPGRDALEPVQFKDVVSSVGHLFGTMLGGVLKVGGALASEVASQHENHRRSMLERRSDGFVGGEKSTDEAKIAPAAPFSRSAPSSNPGPDGERSSLNRPRRGAMVIEEVE